MSGTRNEEEKQRLDKEDQKNDQIREMGQVILDKNEGKRRVELLTIIGEVEGHESAPSQSKTTKYEHVLPKLALVEDDEEIEGLLVLLNTVGGDVEAGLAIAEMIASLSIPTVSLVLGGGHSIGVPMAVSADYSFVVPSATMVIHPVRSSERSSAWPRPTGTWKRSRTGSHRLLPAIPGSPRNALKNSCWIPRSL